MPALASSSVPCDTGVPYRASDRRGSNVLHSLATPPFYGRAPPPLVGSLTPPSPSLSASTPGDVSATVGGQRPSDPSRSARAVLRRLDGFLRKQFAGLLHPAGDPGVRRVSGRPRRPTPPRPGCPERIDRRGRMPSSRRCSHPSEVCPLLAARIAGRVTTSLALFLFDATARLSSQPRFEVGGARSARRVTVPCGTSTRATGNHASGLAPPGSEVASANAAPPPCSSSGSGPCSTSRFAPAHRVAPVKMADPLLGLGPLQGHPTTAVLVQPATRMRAGTPERSWAWYP